MSRKKVAVKPRLYGDLVGGIAGVLEAARRASARTVNAIMTATYWEIGRRIVEYEQQGKARAEYGEALLKRLATDLTVRCGRGFSETRLKKYRQFYLALPEPETGQSVSGGLPGAVSEIGPTVSDQLSRAGGKGPTVSGISRLTRLAARFPLPWSDYVRLLAVRNENARVFYETETLRAGWSSCSST